MTLPIQRKQDESITEFKTRTIRAKALDEVRDRLMSIEFKQDGLPIGARQGFAKMRTQAQTLITQMMEE